MTDTNSTSHGPIQLSVLDSFYAPRIYMTLLVGYNVDKLGKAGSDVLIEILQRMILTTVKQCPILAGTVQADPQTDGMRMLAHLPRPQTDPGSVFKLVRHDDGTMAPYAELEAASFTPSRFDVSLLCTFPYAPSADAASPVFGVQVNIIKGGIVIAIQLHHAIADGRTLGQISSFMFALLGEQQMAPIPSLEYRSPKLEDHVEVGDPHEIVKLCEERLLVRSNLSGPPETNGHAPIVQTLLFTSTSRVEALREKCTKALGKANESAHISKNDVLGAYIWSCITAARFANREVDEKMQSSCHVPCDVRKRINPPIPETYFGTAVLTVSTRRSLVEIIHAITSLSKHDDALPLARLALAIRAAVSKVDTDYVKRRVQLALSVEAANAQSTDQLQIRHVFDPAQHIDVVFSTLAPIFNMEDAALEMIRPDFVRPLHHASVDGVVDVVPALDVTKVEMTVALEEAVVKGLLQMKAWTEFIEQTVV